MNTIISQDLSAVGRYGCLHEFREARKAAYFKPTVRSDMFILVSSRYIYWGKPRSGALLIGSNVERNRFYPFIVFYNLSPLSFYKLRNEVTGILISINRVILCNESGAF